MKLPVGSGFWPAFWALGYEGGWLECGEIDIMEYTSEADWVSAALHAPGYFGETPIFNKIYLSPDNDATHWHVYSAEWQLDGCVFKIDDFLVYWVNRHMTDFYGGWPFDRPKYLLLNFALAATSPSRSMASNHPIWASRKALCN